MLLACLILASSIPGQGLVRGPYLQAARHNKMFVQWRTSGLTDSVVRYGTSPTNLNQIISVPGTRTEHLVSIGGLAPATRYWYSIGNSSQVFASGADCYFQTSPVPGTVTPARVWVLGDSGTANTNAARVRNAYKAYAAGRHTDLLLMLGDNAYNSGTDAEYQAAVFDMYPAILRNTVLWPTMGNHDAHSTLTAVGSETGPYFDIFTLPDAGQSGGLGSGGESYYSFDYGHIHFVCLNSAQGDDTYRAAMLAWLDADLASTSQEWVVVFWHHPPYSKASHDSDAESRLIWARQTIVPVLESYGVDLVLCGHSHSYERSMLIDGHHGHSTTFSASAHALDTGDGRLEGAGAYRKPSRGPAPNEGAVYVVAGSSGQVSGGPLNHPVMVESINDLGSVVLDFADTQLDLTFLDEDGNARDRFTMVKGNASAVRRFHTLVDQGEDWAFNDFGVALPTSWRTPGYDDSGWPVGIAPHCHGEPEVVTLTAIGLPTTYLRKTFTLPYDLDPASIEIMRLGTDFDDGVVAWLNGVEIHRSVSMPSQPTIWYNTLAASAHESGRFEYFDVTSFASVLVPGANVLAVEVHQQSLGSTDLLHDMTLEVESFKSWLGPCAAGTVVDANGEPFDVLMVNGSAGGLARSVDTTVGAPMQFDMLQPPTSTYPAGFALAAWLGTPTPSDVVPSVSGIGPLCFDFLSTNAIWITASIGSTGVPGMLFLSHPTPWSMTLATGLPLPVEFTLQAVIMTDPVTFDMTNALRVNVLP